MFFYKHFVADPDTVTTTREAEREDIERHLGWLLTSVRGVTSFLPTLGISDVVHRPSANMIADLRAEVLETLDRYEPRLEVLSIREDWDDDAERPYLLVEARIRSSAERLQLSLDVARKRMIFAGGPEKADADDA